MSEPRLVSPLLDRFIMGDAISDHHGIRCCPALVTNTEEKYIVKILSFPASQAQLDALLLSGAYHSREAALHYFRQLADETAEEAALLQTLSRLEGFRAFEDWQIEPAEDGSGYDVYLLSRYEPTLQRQTAATHLAAVNLGLDLCAALSVSRRSGYLYVDLKPENIYYSDSKGFLIGDLGFISLRSLKYASLPDKYRSGYTAPEITDAFSSLNDTLDIYAAGMVLYGVYNGGVLPADPMFPEDPLYADGEMAAIILKAIAPDPAERWQDPQQMGQAIAGYMQRNTVNDDPIIPLPEPEPESDPKPVSQSDNDCKVEEAPQPAEVFTEEMETEPQIQAVAEPDVEESPSISADASVAEESEPDAEEAAPAVSEEGSDAPAAEAEEPDEMVQFVIEGFLFDDDPSIDTEGARLTDEVSEMLAQADELIAHKAPEPVIAPEPLEIPMPQPILPEPEEQDSEPAPESVEPAEDPAADLPEPEEQKTDPIVPDVPAHVPQPKKRHLGWLASLLAVVLLLLLAGVGGDYYYRNVYLQNIAGITLDGAEDWLNVCLDTQIDDSLLKISCSDPYGNTLYRPVENGQASFTGLHSGTAYTVSVSIQGNHKLTGVTTATHVTAQQTRILDFTAIAGDTDGSVILRFSVQGPDSTWLVKYSADGIPEQTAVCSSHTAMISGLAVDKAYTFRLVPQEELYVVSGDSLTFTPSRVIYPEDLTIRGFQNGCLIADWKVPEGCTVSGWTVRCYNSSGYDATFTVTEPYISIPDLNIADGYTLDVTANGMTVSKWTSISPNSITFHDFLLDNSDPSKLIVTWLYEGTAPAQGWLLRVTLDGLSMDILCEKNSCTLDRLIPGGSYSFQFLLPEDLTVIGQCPDFTAPDIGSFSGYGVTSADMLVKMCRTPGTAGWSHADIKAEDYLTDFAPGDSIGFVLQLTEEYTTSPDIIQVRYILRSADGNLLSETTYDQTWTNLWYKGFCELDLPLILTATGDYTVEILFNNTRVTAQPICFRVITDTPAA